MVAMLASVTTVLTNSFAGRLLHRAQLTGGRQPSREQTEPVPGAPAPETAETAWAAEKSERVLRLQVAGMHCAGCADNIGVSLTNIEGVQSAVAHHESSVVEVVHVPSKVGEDTIREHIHELGFTVTGHAPSGKVRP